MKVTIILIVNDAHGTVTKGLIKGLAKLEIRGRVEAIKTAALIKLAIIVRRVLETWGTCCYSDSTGKLSANTDVKNNQKSNIEKHEGGLITAIKNDTDIKVTNRMTITRKQKWKNNSTSD